MLASAELAPPPLPGAGERGRANGWHAVLRRPDGALGAALVATVVALALLAPLLAPGDPHLLAGAPLHAPSRAHLLGTDALGRDLLGGVLHGARTSLLVAAAVTILVGACGALVGLVAGWRGGVADDLLMRATELFQVLPRFFLVVVAVAMFGPGIDRMIVTLGLTSWPVLARVLRSEVIALRDLEYVVAARALGASDGRILWRQVLPNALPAAAVVLGLLFGQVLLVEASLGFLGLGDPDTITWGVLAGQAQGFVRVAWWLAVFPGLAVALAVLGVNLLADAWAAALSGR